MSQMTPFGPWWPPPPGPNMSWRRAEQCHRVPLFRRRDDWAIWAAELDLPRFAAETRPSRWRPLAWFRWARMTRGWR